MTKKKNFSEGTRKTLLTSFGENIPTEHCEMVLLAKYLNHKGLFWLHVPNEGKRSPITAKQLSMIGLRKGAADVIIMQSPPKNKEARGVMIEMKRIVGGKLSQDQEKFLSEARDCGWLTCVSKGWQEAVSFLNDLGW